MNYCHPQQELTVLQSGDYPLFGKVKGINYYQLIEDKYKGNESLFWEAIFKTLSSDNPILFADTDVLFRLKVQYLKNILQVPSVDTIASYFDFEQTNSELNEFFFPEKWTKKNTEQELLPIAIQTQLENIYSETGEIDALQRLKFKDYAFEFQLSNFYQGESLSNKRHFLWEIEQFAWRDFAKTLVSRKEDYFISLYAFSHYKGLKFPEKINESTLIEHIENKLKMPWLLDRNISQSSAYYIKSQYRPDDFVASTIELDEFSGGQIKASEKGQKLREKHALRLRRRLEYLFDTDFNEQMCRSLDFIHYLREMILDSDREDINLTFLNFVFANAETPEKLKSFQVKSSS